MRRGVSILAGVDATIQLIKLFAPPLSNPTKVNQSVNQSIDQSINQSILSSLPLSFITVHAGSITVDPVIHAGSITIDPVNHAGFITVDPVNHALTFAAASSSLILFNFSLFASIIENAFASSPSASLNLMHRKRIRRI